MCRAIERNGTPRSHCAVTYGIIARSTRSRVGGQGPQAWRQSPAIAPKAAAKPGFAAGAPPGRSESSGQSPHPRPVILPALPPPCYQGAAGAQNLPSTSPGDSDAAQ